MIELYRIALEEYRFQVNLNWNRTQYYLALNIGLIGIATGILELAEGSVSLLTGGLYLAGLVCCSLSYAAVRVQQGYYQAARDHKAAIEHCLGLGDLSVTTTPGMGSTIRRLGKVNTFNLVVLGVLALMNAIGVVVVARQ